MIFPCDPRTTIYQGRRAETAGPAVVKATSYILIAPPPTRIFVRCACRPHGPYLKQASTPQLSLKSFEMGVMFLPSLLGQPPPVSDKSGDGGGDAEPLAFTCTPGEAGLTQRFPLSLLYECEPGKALPLELLPLPYVLPGERDGNPFCRRAGVYKQGYRNA